MQLVRCLTYSKYPDMALKILCLLMKRKINSLEACKRHLENLLAVRMKIYYLKDGRT